MKTLSWVKNTYWQVTLILRQIKNLTACVQALELNNNKKKKVEKEIHLSNKKIKTKRKQYLQNK